ncbi:hypothetical protein Tgr7_0066 [Thioalkalivibrio sulfidiphilus HL-EbGr7]|uniref:Uncharacterized protein n=1 Tax=Thioalkalivibrio sulfidiphilus (strain HL-EbGR7) TaxID=396588 RepID=B8GTB0_THISH|nr:hypothetical protein [Thioalkalivibrio sulfidiphilus]ACL71170.1 hypothetical protein Tgr7_0066 [Thioalkalivibrio sulfidiphilus HL-EbGr7]
MSNGVKQILVVAGDDKVEALRMATGLTLLDDAVRVAVLGDLDETADDVQLQLESLEFADVPVERLGNGPESYKALAGMMIQSDTVFMV